MSETPLRLLRAGFTLIELLVTLAVASILVAVAAPSFRDMIADSQRDSMVYGLIGDLRFARSEAIKRSSRVSVCARATNGASTCSAAVNPDWDLGWLVFLDDGANAGSIDLAPDEPLLRVSAPVEPAFTLSTLARIGGGAQAPAARTFVRFGPRGTSNWRGGGTFVFCEDEGDAAMRIARAVAVNVSMSGDVRHARRDGDGDLINAFGTAAACAATVPG